MLKTLIFIILFYFKIVTSTDNEEFCSLKENSVCSQHQINAEQFLANLNIELKERKNAEFESKYNYNINITEENEAKMVSIITNSSQFFKDIAQNIIKLNYKNIRKENIARQIRRLSNLGYNVLPEKDLSELLNAITKMQSNYAKVLICEYKNATNCKMSLEPEVELKIHKSRDPDELKYYWREFYDKAGTPVKEHFLKYIEIGRKSAKLNNFTSMAETWIAEYDDPDFEKHLEDNYQEILPFYKQLHGYVRYRLRQYYGDENVSENGNLPLHLLGNLWGQNFESIFDLLKPFPNTEDFDVSNEMIKQGYTPIKIFQMGDEFFQSMNMSKLPEIFWTKSVLEKPSDRDIVCHASAWDFFQKDIVAIKQCTKVNMNHFYIAHHELGHIQYYLLYQDQPVPFRRDPNPGFHEAVGDAIALSVATPKHLTKIGLLKNFEYDKKSQINTLFNTALKKIPLLPFAYTIDKYRYAVFRNEIKLDELNCKFWKMRSEFGGIEPAVERNEKDFDPTAKYHIDADVEYLRYFAAHIFQFQFHKAMCLKAGEYVKGDPKLTLDNCDIHGSVEAGNAFKSMLELGDSKPWQKILQEFTGEQIMSSSALLEYFEPLQKWLEHENKKLGVPIGWEITDKCASGQSS